MELNGITSESTNLYDPDFSIWKMYKILFNQWSLLFRIGFENNNLGVPKASLVEISKAIFIFTEGTAKSILDRINFLNIFYRFRFFLKLI